MLVPCLYSRVFLSFKRYTLKYLGVVISTCLQLSFSSEEDTHPHKHIYSREERIWQSKMLTGNLAGGYTWVLCTILVTFKKLKFTFSDTLQAYLKDIVDLVLDNHNKANIAVKWVKQMFSFFSAYKGYVYTILQSKCATALGLKKHCLYFKNALLLKHANHHLTRQDCHKASICKKCLSVKHKKKKKKSESQ